jgi:competence protein ComEC
MALHRVHARAPAALRLAPHGLLALLCGGLLAALAAAAPVAGAAGAAVAAALAAGGCALRGRAGPALALLGAAVALAGWAWGTARLAATAAPRLDLPARASGAVVVDATPVPDGRGGVRARAVASGLALEPGGPVPDGTRLLLDLDDGRSPPGLGDRLRVEGRMRPAADRDDPGWWRRWLARQAIAGRLRPDVATPDGRRGGPAGLRDRWRRWTAASAGAGLEGDRRELVRGMALGGGAGLSQEAADAFRDAGLWHLLAVSGQNVTVVAVAALALLMAAGLRRRAAVAGAAAVMAAYCLACEGGASVGRAGIVGGLGLVAELRSSPRERWYLLLAGLALLLAHQPRAIGDPGLQLSFAAVAGLFTIAPPLAAWLRGWLPGRVADLAAMAGAAGLATAPVLVWQFGRLSLAGLALNVVAVPLAAPVVVLALAGIAAGALLPAAGVALAWVAGLGAAALLAAARAAAAIPGAAVDVPGWAGPLLVPLGVAPPLVARALGPGEGGARLRALPWRALAVAAAAAAAAALAGWALTRPGPPPPWPAAPAVTALDVGQGDAILLRSPEGAAALVDAGPPGPPAPVAAALARLGVRRLDALILTHDSLDHVGGGIAVLDRVDVGVVLHEPAPEDGFAPAHRRVTDAARARGVPVGELRAGSRLTAGRWGLRVLSPARGRVAGQDPNPASLVALASADGLDVLLTADAESDALARLSLPRVDVLKVSHHGSEDPGLAPVLGRLRPAAALISAGEGNPFRHPRPETLAALAAAGVAAWRTDRSGDVTATASGPGVAVAASR